ncbi:Major facilitator superfamily protein [Perilla frutescens var. frutescens]|nr:Major facilitator superfamily protein [Perilla frutescens var. frutescens]
MEKNEMSATKKEPNYRGIKAMPYVIGNETFEKLGTIGTTTNLIVYLTTVFNMNSTTANKVLNTFNGTCNFGTLAGAFLSDTYLGRYNTICISSVSSFLGMLVLTMTAAFPKLHPEKCLAKQENSKCSSGSSSTGQLAFLYSGFVLLVIGASGIRPCNLAFGVDQFNPKTDSGRRGIATFFNWYYFTYTFGMLLSLTVVVFVQSEHWAMGLAIPTFLMLLSCVLFFVGSTAFVKVLPDGSPLTNVVQTLVVAFKKRKLEYLPPHEVPLFNHIPSHSINSTLPLTNQLRFLNKASIVTPDDEIKGDGSAGNPWRLRSLQQVEEMKCVVKVIPIWISGMIYNVALNQTQNYVVLQATQSDRHLGLGNNKFQIPQATYNVFTMIGMAIWILFYDRLLRRIRVLTILQRVGTGIAFIVLAMIVSGIVENRRRSVRVASSMSANWLIPQLLLAGLSEGMGIIGLVEFYYSQFPENMRSLGSSLLFAGFALSFYLSNLLISVVDLATKGRWLAQDLNEGRLDLFYYVIAGLQFLNFIYFLLCAKCYNYTTAAAAAAH